MKMRAIVMGVVVLVAAVAGTYLVTRPGQPVVTAPGESNPAAASAQDEGRPVPSKTGPHPKAVVAEGEVFEFGSMAVNETRSHTFEIENKGEAPLLLKAGRPTCKCTMSLLENESIPAGQKTTVVLKWEPKEINPDFSQRAPIYTNDPEKQEISLQIKGEVGEVLTKEPAGDWNLGDLPEDKPVEVTGAIFSRTLDKFAITEIESKFERLKVESSPMTEEQLKAKRAKSGYELKATLLPGSPVGDVRVSATLKTDVNGHADFALGMSGVRPGPVRFYPILSKGTVWMPEAKALDLGEFPAKDGRKSKLMILVAGMDEEFKVTKVDSDTPFIKVELNREGEPTTGGKQRFVITFEVPPDSPKTTKIRSGAAKIKLHTNHPAMPEMDFRVELISL